MRLHWIISFIYILIAQTNGNKYNISNAGLRQADKIFYLLALSPLIFVLFLLAKIYSYAKNTMHGMRVIPIFSSSIH